MTIGQIRDHFGLETMGDAWALVMDNDWESYQGGVPDHPETWLVKVPEEAL